MQALRVTFAAAAISAITCPAAAAYPTTLTLKLYAQNRPGETGTVTFKQVPGGVRVAIKMAGGGNGRQPVHIHEGACGNLNPLPKYSLGDIVHGSDTTMISGITIGDLLKGKYAIDVHFSSADIKRYVACADIAALRNAQQS